MGDPILVAVLDPIYEMALLMLVLVMALSWGITLAMLFDSRQDFRDLEAERLGPKIRPGLHRLATEMRPPPPAPPAPLPVDRWPFDPPPDVGPLLRNQWEQPPPVTPVPWPDPDVADDLEQIVGWHNKTTDEPEPDATLTELGQRWHAAEAQAAELGWPPLIASADAASPVEKPAEPPVTSDEPPGEDQVEPAGPLLTQPPTTPEIDDYTHRLTWPDLDHTGDTPAVTQ